MHHLLENRILPVLAGAAVVVVGLNVASYAAKDSSAQHPSRAATRANPFGGSSAARTTLTGTAARTSVGAYVYRIPKHTTLPFLIRLKGVPAGKYTASFDIATITATPTGQAPLCFVEDSAALDAVVSYGPDQGSATNDIAINSATGLVRLANKNEVAIGCEFADHTYQAGGFKNTVLLTPVHHVVTTKGHPLPPPPKAAFRR